MLMEGTPFQRNEEEVEKKGQGQAQPESAGDSAGTEPEKTTGSEQAPTEGAPPVAEPGTAAGGEGAPSETEPGEGGEEDELARIRKELAQLMGEKEKQARHAARKITELGQEVRSRDLELEQLRRELAALRRELQRRSSSQEYSLFGEEEETPAAQPQVTERIPLLEQAVLELYDELLNMRSSFERERQVQQIQKELNLPEEYAQAYVDAVAAGDMARAAKIVKLAEREQLIRERRRLAQRRSQAAKAGVGAPGSSPPKKAGPSLLEKLSQLPEWERARFLAEHPEILDELGEEL